MDWAIAGHFPRLGGNCYPGHQQSNDTRHEEMHRAEVNPVGKALQPVVHINPGDGPGDENCDADEKEEESSEEEAE